MVIKKKRISVEDKIGHLVELACHYSKRPTLEELRSDVIDICSGNPSLKKSLLKFLDKYGLAEILGRCRRDSSAHHPAMGYQAWIDERFDFER